MTHCYAADTVVLPSLHHFCENKRNFMTKKQNYNSTIRLINFISVPCKEYFCALNFLDNLNINIFLLSLMMEISFSVISDTGTPAYTCTEITGSFCLQINWHEHLIRYTLCIISNLRLLKWENYHSKSCVMWQTSPGIEVVITRSE